MLTLAILASVGTTIIVLFLLCIVVYLWITQASGCRNCGHDVFYQAFNGLERCEECDWPKEELFPNQEMIAVEMSDLDDGLDSAVVCLIKTGEIAEIRSILAEKNVESVVSVLTPENKQMLYESRSLALPLILTLDDFKQGIEKGWINWGSAVGWQKHRLGRINYRFGIIFIRRCLESSISPLWKKTHYQICVE